MNEAYKTSKKVSVEAIRRQYLNPEENKMEQLQRLDQKVKQPGMVLSLILGTVGALTLGGGLGMSIMQPGHLVPSIVIGTIGLIILSLAYPAYTRITKKQKEKYSSAIFRLSDELLNEK